MTKSEIKTTYLKDYQAPRYWVDTVDLKFELEDNLTIVTALIQFHKNMAVQDSDPNSKNLLFLNGDNLKLMSIHLNDKPLSSSEYKVEEEGLTIFSVPENFVLKTVTEIHPEKNTELSGLYRSKALFCTQCEAEGFRRITFYPDRPDVMASFKTTIVADKTKYPVLLSNGNCIAEGGLIDSDNRKHFVTWEDPFKKPAYLFALVAGDLVALEDHFVTLSQRLITLKIYVERENQAKCGYAMEALKKSMLWDEQTYGREYDLDIYMIVAVNDFNMGAMENKGLNIFNSKYILASPDTATDTDYENIDAVVGHEYFHNWSGNRITCRDWFQLSLKEGLTVFREQHFVTDLSKSPISLIEHASGLRSHQFVEDAGPLAHPVRPEAYVEIDNFYTATVYEKGAEVIRMIKTILGWDAFRRGMDLYFERHDGQAVTIEDFVKAMEDASKQDLSQFKLWYSQAGTPEIAFEKHYDKTKATCTLTIKQHCPATPGQPNKLPMLIPIALGLLSSKGQDFIGTKILLLKEKEQSFSFENIPEDPYVSLLRGFSAPVKVVTERKEEELNFLLSHDTDDFNRWDSAQKLAEMEILRLAKQAEKKENLSLSKKWLESFTQVFKNTSLNLALKSEILTLPSLSSLAERVEEADPDILYAAKKHISSSFAAEWKGDLLKFYKENLTPGVYHYTARDAEKRTFKNMCLDYLMEIEVQEHIDLCMHQFHSANNMTDCYAALGMIVDLNCKERDLALMEFYEKFKEDPLVVNKWFRAQAYSILPNTLDHVKELMKHPAFSIKNPNNVYSLVAAFCSGNFLRFHDISGQGYRFLGDVVIQLNELNPLVAARILEPLTRFRRFNKPRQEKMRAELERIQAIPKLSKDVLEIVTKSLA